MIGRYLSERPQRILFTLASRNPWECRTAIVITQYFVPNADVADTFALAEILRDDPNDSIQKATGGLLREAGKKDRAQLLRFLDLHAATMARTTLSYAMEHLEKGERELLDQASWETFGGGQDYAQAKRVTGAARSLFRPDRFNTDLDNIVDEAFDLLEEPGVWRSVEHLASDLLRFKELDYAGIKDAVLNYDAIRTQTIVDRLNWR